MCVYECTLCARCCCGYGFCSFSALIWDFQRKLHSLKIELSAFSHALTLFSSKIRKFKLASRRTFHMRNESHCLWFNVYKRTHKHKARLIYIATKSFWLNEIPNASNSCCNFDELQFFDFSSGHIPFPLPSSSFTLFTFKHVFCVPVPIPIIRRRHACNTIRPFPLSEHRYEHFHPEFLFRFSNTENYK